MSLILDGTNGITFPAGGITLPGSTSGTCNITATAISGTAVLTMPTGTDTLVGKATTDTMTNKTLTAPVLSGSVTGTYTLAGTPTITAPIVSYSINAQTTAAYVTVASDAGAIVTVSNASANTFKLPTNASVAYAIGSTITLIQIGAGATTISAVTPGTTTVLSTGATAASPVLAQYRSATCIKTGTDAWYVIGALA